MTHSQSPSQIAARAIAKASARRFTDEDAATVRRCAAQASAICRSVSLAIDAILDGSIALENPSAQRWHVAIELASQRVRSVGKLLLERQAAPSLDWWTSSNLLEALAAAMWHTTPAAGQRSLDDEDVSLMLDAVVEALDELLSSASAETSDA